MEEKRKAISIHQPAYLPWLGYFHKIMLSDVFVYLDTVQYEKNSFINRNKIKGAKDSIWLTVPVKLKGHTQTTIKAVEIDNTQKWKQKHLKSIKINYSKAPFFKKYFPEIEALVNKKWDRLTDLTRDMLVFFLGILNIDTEIINSEDLLLETKKANLVLEICKKLNADIYISGVLGKNYLDDNHFKKTKIDIIYQEYNHPVYKQQYENFISHMCIMDLLFNYGPSSNDIICNGNIKRNDIENRWRHYGALFRL